MFAIEIPDEEAEKMRTVRDAILSVEKYRRERSPKLDEPAKEEARAMTPPSAPL